MGLTRRKYLSGNFAKKKMDIDMEKVYREIDAGKTIAQVAKGLGCSESTLRRRHREYQKKVDALLHEPVLDPYLDMHLPEELQKM